MEKKSHKRTPIKITADFLTASLKIKKLEQYTASSK